MESQPRVTNENLAEQLDNIRVEVERSAENVAALVHDAITNHVRTLPHSGISREEAILQIERINALTRTNLRLIEILEGKVEPDLRGNPRLVEPGLTHKIDAIKNQTNGTKPMKLPVPAWVGIVGSLAAAIWNALQN